MFVAGAAPKGSLFGTGKATGLEEFKPKPGNLEFVGGGGDAVAGNGPPETEVATAGPGPKPKVAILIPIFGQNVLLFCTGLMPVVGQGLLLCQVGST